MAKMAKVLVIDDEPVIRKSCDKVLRRAGFEVDWVTDGHYGLEKIRENGFDVVLLDLKMPGIDGVEVMRRIRESGKDIKVIIITAYPSVESMLETAKLGSVDYVLKPFTPNELVSAVNRVLRERTPVEEDRFAERVIDHDKMERVKLERRKNGMTVQIGAAMGLQLEDSLGQIRSIQTVSHDGKRVAILGIEDLFDSMATLPRTIIKELKRDFASLYTVYGTREIEGIDILTYLEENDIVVVLTRLKKGEGKETVQRLDNKPGVEVPKIGYPQVKDWIKKMGIDTDLFIIGLFIDFDEKDRKTEEKCIRELNKILSEV